MDMHPNQLPISVSTVRALVHAQFDAWSELEITQISAGTENAIFRIGASLVARFRLQAGDLRTTRISISTEVATAERFADRTGFTTPVPVAVGEPGEGYPLPWLVQTWVEGHTATRNDNGGSATFAADLADLIAGIREIDTGGETFDGSGRGGNLAAHDDWVQECLSRSRGLLDVTALSQTWAVTRRLPRGDDPDVINHGDLMPGNLLVADGRLTGVIDVGGLGAADPALDLMSVWHLLDRQRREVLRERLRIGRPEWERGRAWAFEQAIGLVWYYDRTNPIMSAIGRDTLDRILADVEL